MKVIYEELERQSRQLEIIIKLLEQIEENTRRKKNG